MVATYIVPRSHTTLLVLLPVMGACGGLFALFTMYLPPLFPVLLRTTGAGFCYNIGRIAAAAGTVVFGLFSKVGDYRIALLCAGLPFPAGDARSPCGCPISPIATLMTISIGLGRHSDRRLNAHTRPARDAAIPGVEVRSGLWLQQRSPGCVGLRPVGTTAKLSSVIRQGWRRRGDRFMESMIGRTVYVMVGRGAIEIASFAVAIADRIRPAKSNARRPRLSFESIVSLISTIMSARVRIRRM